MFKKGERIEDDFMSYGTRDEEQPQSGGKGGFLTKTIQFLTVVVLVGIIGFMGFFGYRYLEKEQTNTALLQSKVAVVPSADSHGSQVTSAVPKHTSTHKKMYTKEEMEEIVKMLMAQMQQGQQSKVTTDGKLQLQAQTSKSGAVASSEDLVAALDIAEVDDVEEEDPAIPTDLEALDAIKAKSAQKHVKVDNYNKVLVKKSMDRDTMSNLSAEIGDIVKTMNKKKSSGYTASIRKEVVARTKEMRVVVVRRGDTLSQIAKRVYGRAMDYDRILKANPDLIKNPNNIYIGQRLRVPMN